MAVHRKHSWTLIAPQTYRHTRTQAVIKANLDDFILTLPDGTERTYLRMVDAIMAGEQ